MEENALIFGNLLAFRLERLVIQHSSKEETPRFLFRDGWPFFTKMIFTRLREHTK